MQTRGPSAATWLWQRTRGREQQRHRWRNLASRSRQSPHLAYMQWHRLLVTPRHYWPIIVTGTVGKGRSGIARERFLGGQGEETTRRVPNIRGDGRKQSSPLKMYNIKETGVISRQKRRYRKKGSSLPFCFLPKTPAWPKRVRHAPSLNWTIWTFLLIQSLRFLLASYLFAQKHCDSKLSVPLFHLLGSTQGIKTLGFNAFRSRI